MSDKVKNEENNVNERIEKLNKTIKIRKSVLDKMVKKLNKKENKRTEN